MAATPSFNPPPPPGFPPPIDKSRIRPGRWLYVLAALVGVGSIVAAVLLFVSALRPAFDELTPFVTPQSVTIALESGDERTIYQQVRGAEAGGGNVGSGSLDCDVSGSESEARIPLTRVGGTTLTRGEDEYVGEFDFSVQRTGRYRVTCRGSEETNPHVPMAVGPHLSAFGIIGSVLGVLASLFGGGFLTVLIIGLTAFLRYRSKKRLKAEAAGGRAA